MLNTGTPTTGTIHHPAFGGLPLRYSFSALPDDPDSQVATTIGMMGRYARQDAFTPAIQADARQAMAECPGCSPEEAVFRFVRKRVSFREDEDNARPLTGLANGQEIVEVLIRPVDMSQMCAGNGCRRAGDCDDYSMYGAALLLALGREPVFRTIAGDPNHPELYSHVYLVSYLPDGTRVPVDISHGKYVGWEAPTAGRQREWSLGEEDLHTLVLGLVAAAGWWWLKKREAL